MAYVIPARHPSMTKETDPTEDVPEAALRPNGRGLAFAVGEAGELALGDPCSPLPQNLKRRLTEGHEKQISKEDIEGKLKAAEQKRAAFLEWLADKARPKQRAAPVTQPAEDLAQRLEAKLSAAEAKRQELRAQDLARLAERHGAVEAALRSAKEVPLREDTTSERIRRADEKRLALLEAERSRASERVMQARQVAAAVIANRERDSVERQERLEAKLQRAAQRRETLLSQRSTTAGVGTQKRAQGDKLSRSLSRCWREFRRTGKTTAQLAAGFKQCGLSRHTAANMPFEQFAGVITSAKTLREVKALLARLERRLLVSTGQSNAADCERLLRRLQTAATVGRSPASSPSSSRNASPAPRATKPTTKQPPLERYPARVFLCAYMLLAHPDAVFNVKGPRESALVEAAEKMLPEFEALLENITTPGGRPRRPFAAQLAAFDAAWLHYLDQFVAWKVKDAAALVDDLIRMAVQLEASMLQKTGTERTDTQLSHDQSAIRAHVLVDQTLLRDRIGQLGGEQGLAQLEAALQDLRTNFVVEQRLSSSPSSAGSTPLSSPPSSPPESRRESLGSPLGGGGSRSLGSSPPVTRRSSFGFKFPPTRPAPPVKGSSQPQASVSGFAAAGVPPSPRKPNLTRLTIPDDPTSPAVTRSAPPSLLPSPVLPPATLSNVGMVHELLYNPNWQLPNNPANEPDPDDQSGFGGIQAKLRATLESAFWAGVEEGLRATPPDWKRVASLVGEVRDELLAVAPAKWRDDISEKMDTELLQQVLEANNDVAHLRGLLDYAADLILKLGAPIRDSEQRALHQSLLADLASGGPAEVPLVVTKGLRFLFDRIKVLKRDMSNAQLRSLAPMVTRAGAGLDYERAWFVQQLGLADLPAGTRVAEKLPKTAPWLVAARAEAERVREEVESQFEQAAAAGAGAAAPTVVLPAMRTGGSRSPAVSMSSSQIAAVLSPMPAGPVTVDWASVETAVKLGLLHLVQETAGATEATVPETLLLDIGRIRGCQNAYQRLLVLSTGLLLARQALAGKPVGVISNDPTARMQALEAALGAIRRRLADLIEEPDANVAKIGELVAMGVAEYAGEEAAPADVETMTRLVNKATTPGDALFVLVGKAVAGALRSALLSPGKSPVGAAASAAALRRAGAALLAEDAIRAADELRKIVDVNTRVHGGLYVELLC